MQYISTRGTAPALPFDDVLLTGLARDGGLYVPEIWPRFTADEMHGMADLSYPDLAARIIAPFIGETIAPDECAALVADAYADFTHDPVAPLRKLGENEWLLELFHGPTLAFKDYALQLVGRLFDDVLARRGERITIVGATSGDTGSAAIAACRGSKAIDIFMLHPQGRVSEVQRRQMTTVADANVFNIAIEGTFDDCQNIVKALFNDLAFRDEVHLSAVNSINWARIMAQIVYYFWAGLKCGAPGREISFAVPTGIFGNVYAGYAARAMGLPVAQFIVGSNRNDILTRFFESGVMEMRGVEASLSPSMDIQISSNFERLLFDLYGRDGARVACLMEEFRLSGKFAVDGDVLAQARALFSGYSLDDEGTKAAIKALFGETGMVIDPHTAVGIMAGRARRKDVAVPLIAMATAHPAKFPVAVEDALGVHDPCLDRLQDLFALEEKSHALPNDVGAVAAYIRAQAVLTSNGKQGAP